MDPNNQLKKRSKKKKDIALVISLAVAAVLIAAALIPVIYSGVLSAKYQEYVKRYTDSMNLSRRAGSVTIVRDNETKTIPVDAASQIYALLLDAGMGKPQTITPEELPSEICFADRARLQFWTAQIPEKSAQRSTGLLIKYQAADGYVYQYDTDALTMDSIVSKLQ